MYLTTNDFNHGKLQPPKTCHHVRKSVLIVVQFNFPPLVRNYAYATALSSSQVQVNLNM